jgi:hypothetical protein
MKHCQSLDDATAMPTVERWERLKQADKNRLLWWDGQIAQWEHTRG